MLDKKLLRAIWDEFENPNKRLFQTGFEDLDTIMGLPEDKGALITIGARPSMGKTTFILTLAENMLKQYKRVLIFSLDLTIEQITKKLLFMYSEVGAAKLMMKRLSPIDYTELGEAIKYYAEADLFIEDSSCINIEQIEDKIKEIKPNVVFIDFLQLISSDKQMDRSSQIEDICANLKRISQENNVVIFAASQISRSVEARQDKRPMLSDLREAGAIENISDVVLFIYREDYYGNDQEYVKEGDITRPKGDTEIIAAKNRFGVCASLLLTFKAHIPKFYGYRS